MSRPAFSWPSWHAPEAQLIPAEKVLLMESVGSQSPLAQLIAQDQAKK